MALIEIKRNPTVKDLRWFGILLAAFVILVGAIARWKFERPVPAQAIWTVGAVIVGVYAAIPSLRRWIYLGWLYAVFPIGWTVSHVLLAAIYFLVVTPIGFLLRLIKGDPLERAPDRSATTYWAERPKATDMRRYFRQF